MRHDFDAALALEVKRELAERYFGFRKLIEDDLRDYDARLRQATEALERHIGFDLVRLYILLKDDNLIHEFLTLTGLTERIFHDPWLAQSANIRRRVFAGQHVRGLTRAGRFHNMLFDTYDLLVEHVAGYREALQQLVKERQDIADEIEQFYRQNDIGMIMGFFRGLDGGGDVSGGMAGTLVEDPSRGLAKKLKLSPPPPPETALPPLPQLPQLADIRSRLKQLSQRAFVLNGDLDIKTLCQPLEEES